MTDLDQLQSYVGSQIAFYVSFLTVLTAWQCVMVIPALGFTLLQLCFGLQIRLVLWNMLVVAVWAVGPQR
jgi:hypothetical protein